MNTQDAKRVLETALICASQPLSLREMRVLFEDQLGADSLRMVLDELMQDWSGRGSNSSGWPRAGDSRVAPNCASTWIA